MSDFQREVVEAVAKYEHYGRDDLLAELTRLATPSRYHDAPGSGQLRKEGATLWNSYRRNMARLICADRTAGGDRRVNALVTAGLVAFVKDIGAVVLGNAIGAHVTTAMVGATAVLLYQELQSGVDAFCAAHYTRDED